MNRRGVVRSLMLGSAAAGLSACLAPRTRPSAAKVVVVGGGYGGTAAAKYLRLLSNHTIDVVLIEPAPQFISAPLSNLVVGGILQLADLTVSYEALRRRHGVTLIHDRVSRIDPVGKFVSLGAGGSIRYDKLVLSPGIDPMFDAIEGLQNAHAQGRILQGWTAGRETTALHAQLAAMRDGGVFAIAIPEAPYRCPPGPYERASLVAAFLLQHKPKSKVLVLDANQDVVAMNGLFKSAWQDLYGDILEYRNHCKAISVDGAAGTVRFEVADDVTADVLNVLPPVRAGALALQSGLANVNARWCEIDFLSFESKVAKDIHILGDSIQAAPQMPKSGHMANGHAKVAAAAIVAELQGWPPDPAPMLTNTCYSFVSGEEVIHSAAVYDYRPEQSTFKPVAGAGGVSPRPSAQEAKFAKAWAQNIWADMLG
jgi:NADPH-dependent 2,4-dienoyl-CoA reductase/sulfur reductase-like enzyme